MSYFTYFRKKDYLLSETVSKKVTDISQFVSIFHKIVDNIFFYTYYTMNNAERLDTISVKLYDTDDYYWIIPLINSNFVNTWHDLNKSNHQLQNSLLRKYKGMAFTLKSDETIIGKFIPQEKIIDVADPNNYFYLTSKYPSRGYIVGNNFGPDSDFMENTEYTLQGETSGDQIIVQNYIPFHMAPNHYVDDSGNYMLWGSEKIITPITINELEMQKNIDRLQIKVIKPELISDVVSSFKNEIKKATKE